jgi:hypothetical protein
VAIVSGNYLHPACWCNLEREHFLARLGITPQERAAQRRIWIIQIEEVPTAQWQEAFFPDVKAQVFCERDADDRVRLPLLGIDDNDRLLKVRGIRTFFDVDRINPGGLWFDVLEQALRDVKAVVVFLGRSGLGPWQRREVCLSTDKGESSLSEVERNSIVTLLEDLYQPQ